MLLFFILSFKMFISSFKKDNTNNYSEFENFENILDDE